MKTARRPWKYLASHRTRKLLRIPRRPDQIADLRLAEQRDERTHEDGVCPTCGDWVGWNDFCRTCLCYDGFVQFVQFERHAAFSAARKKS